MTEKQEQFARFPGWIRCQSVVDHGGLDYGMLTVAPDSKRVATRPLEAVQLLYIINQEVRVKKRHPLVVLDATGHIGTDALHFAREWPASTVHVYEKDSDIFKILCANVKTFNSEDRVKAVLGSSVPTLTSTDKTHRYDFVYLDPPWGGKGYEKRGTCTLKLDEIPVETLIDAALDSGITPLVFLKAPLNWSGAARLRHGFTRNVVTHAISGKSRKPSFQLLTVR